jgi:hypothetical protein
MTRMAGCSAQPGHQTSGSWRQTSLTGDQLRDRPGDLFHHTIDQEAGEHPRPTIQRDEATMWSLRFPFDEDNCR